MKRHVNNVFEVDPPTLLMKLTNLANNYQEVRFQNL